MDGPLLCSVELVNMKEGAETDQEIYNFVD